jgi:hypothetical protein
MADMSAGTKGFVAECFWPGVREADIESADARARLSAEALDREGQTVHYLGSLLFPSDEVVFFQFDAVSADAVRRASERAAIPFERIVESVGMSAQGRRAHEAGKGGFEG